MRHSMRKRTGARNLSPNSCLPCWRPSSRATETSFAAARPEDERDGDPGSIRQARRGQAPRRARQDDDLSSDPGREVSSAVQTKSEEHTSELQSLMRISYDVFCLKKHRGNL